MTAISSFFDENNTFKFTSLLPKHIQSLTKPHKLEATFLCKSLNSDFSLRGLFKLHDHILAYYDVNNRLIHSLPNPYIDSLSHNPCFCVGSFFLKTN